MGPQGVAQTLLVRRLAARISDVVNLGVRVLDPCAAPAEQPIGND